MKYKFTASSNSQFDLLNSAVVCSVGSTRATCWSVLLSISLVCTVILYHFLSAFFLCMLAT